MLLPLAAYGSVSAVCGGVSDFWPLFWMGYIEWLSVSLADFFLLDVYLLQRLGQRIQVPGTEDIRTIAWAAGSESWRSRSMLWHGRW